MRQPAHQCTIQKEDKAETLNPKTPNHNAAGCGQGPTRQNGCRGHPDHTLHQLRASMRQPAHPSVHFGTTKLLCFVVQECTGRWAERHMNAPTWFAGMTLSIPPPSRDTHKPTLSYSCTTLPMGGHPSVHSDRRMLLSTFLPKCTGRWADR